MNQIVNILEGKTLEAFKQPEIDINVGNWKPNITACKLPNVDFSVNNIGSLFKLNTSTKILDNLNKIRGYLQKFSEGTYDVEIVKLYLNFSLNRRILYEQINSILSSKNIIIQKNNPKNILIDYSSPNIAKDMHVGHLRSTIIGDCLANLFESQGHGVHRINHIGDIGLPMAMIIQYIISENLVTDLFENELPLTLQEIYTKGKKLFDTDDQFNKLSYENTVKLQNYDDNDNIVKIWKIICNISRKAYQEIYDRLSVNLTEYGESFYHKYIPLVIGKLNEKELTRKIDGRLIIETTHGVLTIIKSDGGYTYDTTDVAALWYRLCILDMDKVYYVVDSGQSLHFLQLFEVSKKMGWLRGDKNVEHINFGIVCGTDGKRIRSRKGDTLKLIDLLDYSLKGTDKIMKEKDKTFNDEVIKSLAYGSIKYADLSVGRINDYIFSFERMLSFKGNTLVYVMYARVRILAILRNLDRTDITKENLIQYISNIEDTKINELNRYDYELIFHLMTFNDMISKAEVGFPHYICTYLYSLADMFHNCYMGNRSITFDNEEIISVNKSRVALYIAILEIIDICFKLLNIKPIDYL